MNSKFKVGDRVKWNDGKYYTNDKRIDVITKVITDWVGSVQYLTKEVNNPKNRKPKIGKAYEIYLVLV